MDRTRFLDVGFLRSVIAYFRQLEEERGNPGTKLALEHLVLGFSVYDTASDTPEEDIDCLSNITDMSKLQTLQLLNKSTAREQGWWNNYLDPSHKILRAATNLQKLSIDVLSKGVVELADALLGTSGAFREIEIKTLREYQRSAAEMCPAATRIFRWRLAQNTYRWRTLREM
jgi:hypothetical protein